MLEESILKSTKKILGLDESYTAFDLDIITHINAAFFTLHQIGLGPEEGFSIEDELPVWADFIGPSSIQISLIKTYVFLKVKLIFDPPPTSFHLTAAENQIEQYEWRLREAKELEIIP